MEVRNCKSCGRLYNYIGGAYRNLCPDCISKLEEKFIEVKEYIQDHTTSTMQQISEDCDVRIEQIERWIREDRIFFSDDSPIGIECERCGKTIKSGRYCTECKNTMGNVLSDLYSDDPETYKTKQKKNDERMKILSRSFIDKINSEK